MPPAASPAQHDAAALDALRSEVAALRAVVEVLVERLDGGGQPPPGFAGLEERALTTKGVCDALSIGRTRLYELIAEGHLRPVKLGRELRFPAAQVRAVLRRGTSP